MILKILSADSECDWRQWHGLLSSSISRPNWLEKLSLVYLWVQHSDQFSLIASEPNKYPLPLTGSLFVSTLTNGGAAVEWLSNVLNRKFRVNLINLTMWIGISQQTIFSRFHKLLIVDESFTDREHLLMHSEDAMKTLPLSVFPLFPTPASMRSEQHLIKEHRTSQR